MRHPFLAALFREQARHGLSDGELAQRLGCDRSYLSLLRSGRRKEVGLDIVTRGLRAFPALAGALAEAAHANGDPRNDESPAAAHTGTAGDRHTKEEQCLV